MTNFNVYFIVVWHFKEKLSFELVFKFLSDFLMFYWTKPFDWNFDDPWLRLAEFRIFSENVFAFEGWQLEIKPI